MNTLVEKLAALGIPTDMISTLEEKYGSDLIPQIQTLGLQWVAEKAGLDTSKLPDIDMIQLLSLRSELMGTDIDGDGKTGMSEVLDTATDLLGSTGAGSTIAGMTGSTGGLIDRLKSMF